MKIRIIAAILLPLALISARAFADELGTVRMGIVQGDVQIYTEDARAWVPAAINTPLAQGDRVWVPDGGRSELQFRGGLVIRLDAATSFDILSLGDSTFQFYVNVGRTYVNNHISGIDYLQIDTPVGSIGCYDNSITMIDVEENGATEVSVLKGYAYAETRNGKIRIPSGKTLRIGKNLGAELFPVGSPDAWEKWNRDLDGRIGYGSDSIRYLPNELYDYGYDFDTYGRWLYDSGYGYVWTPTFSISINWAPYHLGRWVWIGGHYVWISREPWGWAPYHYGRWIHRPHVGWCWVPPRHGAAWWGPGYVGWVYTANNVAWVPLAPGDIYYGHGYYGPGSVNINTIVINNIIFNRNYINRNVRNAVRVMGRDAFIYGREAAAPTWNNPFGQRNVGIGPPRFKPDKTTLAPVLKRIPAAKQPPRRIRNIKPETLRIERKLMPDKRGSVFTPGTPARTMPTPSRETPKRIERKPATEMYKIRQQIPRIKETPSTIIKPDTRRRTGKEAEPAAIPKKQPSAISVAPQPVAPQPVAPTRVWSPPSQTKQPAQGVPPGQQSKPTAVPKVRQRAPAVPKQQIRTPRTIPQQQQSQPVSKESPTSRNQLPVASQPIAPTRVWSPPQTGQQTQQVSPKPRQSTPATAPKVRQIAPATPRKQMQAPQPSRQQRQQTIQREQQTIRRLQPATSQPAATQAPANRGTAPATMTPTPRQSGGRAGEQSPQTRGNAHGQNR